EMSCERIGTADRASLARNRRRTLSFALKIAYASNRGANETVLPRATRAMPRPPDWKSSGRREGDPGGTGRDPSMATGRVAIPGCPSMRHSPRFTVLLRKTCHSRNKYKVTKQCHEWN